MFGELSLFLNMSRILAVFDISKPIDELGNDIEQKVDWTDSVITHLQHFDCRIEPRSEEHVALLERQIDA